MLRIATCLVVLISSSVGLCAPDGAKLYQQKCANCHGANGEGNKKEYPQALIGDRSVGQLAKYIGKTMPKDDPESLSAEESQAIAAFIHEAFYSPTAQARNKPPRIELARLTVRQHRQALSDLVASFRNSPTSWGKQNGLNGTYYNGRRMNPQSKMLDRVDAEVNFNFKEESPAPGKVEAIEFNIRWGGSVLAPETGEYEFVVRTDHAARLWVNDNTTPLIDAWVKSGKDTEFKGVIPLVAGRVYSLRLEFSKGKQGVDDSKTNKPKSKPAFVHLEWKRPHRSLEVIPTRFLSTQFVPEQYLPSTAFPPDDRSYGWERGTTVSKEWDAATTEASFELADYLSRKFNELAGTRDGAADQLTKVKNFAKTLAERAFRRPLNSVELKVIVEKPFENSSDLQLSIKRVVLLVTKSPMFLYREVLGGTDQFDTASRLSFALWDSIPDAELWRAAAEGKLKTAEQVRSQAQRMLNDQKAKAKLRGFLNEWLNLSHAQDITKDAKRFPGFDATMVNDLRNSLELSLDEWLSSPTSDFRQLLLSDELYLNGKLAKFYGAELPENAPFQKVKLNADQRAGVVTHPFLMSTFAYTGASSPIHRGVFLVRGVLGVNLRPPQEAFSPIPEGLVPTLTTRERVSMQTKPQNCQTCHGMINGLGFTLESFDAVGRYRQVDNNKPVDSTGVYTSRSGETVKLKGPKDLGQFLANSDEVHQAFVEALFHHLAQQPVRAYGTTQLGQLRDDFVKSGFNAKKLVLDIATKTSLKGREK
jgi:cytochrome c553